MWILLLYHSYLQRAFFSHLFLFLFWEWKLQNLSEVRQYLTTLTKQNCLLVFWWTFLYFSLSPLPLVTGHHWEKPGSGFLTPALQVLTDIDKIPPDPSFLQVEVSKLSWSLLLLVMVQTLSDICNSVLGSLWYFHVFCSGEPRTVSSNPDVYDQCWAEGKDQPVFSLPHQPFILPVHYQFVNDDIVKSC